MSCLTIRQTMSDLGSYEIMKYEKKKSELGGDRTL